MSTPGLSDVGVYGMGVMGEALALNLSSRGFTVSVTNRSASPLRVAAAAARAKAEGLELVGHTECRKFVQSLSVPRKIVILVPAGSPVDEVISVLTPHLDKGDVLIDGGNEWFERSISRASDLASIGIEYIGMGISGGEEGARNGPCLMPSGTLATYTLIEPVITKICAKEGEDVCMAYIGPIGAGHYVKMVHNGIEYALMQLIAETYHVLKRSASLSNLEISEVFSSWNTEELQSYLLQISASILTKQDDQTLDGFLLDKISDRAASKGTGKWTVQQAAELGVAVPTIAAALDARSISSDKEVRERLHARLLDPFSLLKVSRAQLIDDARNALYVCVLVAYAQGMALIRAASVEHVWDVNMSELVRIWRGGCIIRGAVLDVLRDAYLRQSDLPSLLVDEVVSAELNHRVGALRRVVTLCVANGLPASCLTSSVTYMDMHRSERLPTCLVQAQRDLFGAHTYERNDMTGHFHSNWVEEG